MPKCRICGEECFEADLDERNVCTSCWDRLWREREAEDHDDDDEDDEDDDDED